MTLIMSLLSLLHEDGVNGLSVMSYLFSLFITILMPGLIVV